MAKRRNPIFPVWYLLLFLGLSVGIGVAVWQYNLYLLRDTTDLDKLQKMGDAFNGLGALFGGLAFAGVVVAVIMQSVELRNQRQELRDSTESLLMTTYLNALGTLREFYVADAKGERHHDDPTPDMPASTKYRMTMNRLEALVRHLELHETGLRHLEATKVARSEQWLQKLKASVAFYDSKWTQELAKKDKASLRALKGYAVELNNDFEHLYEELETSDLRKHGYAILDHHIKPVITYCSVLEYKQQNDAVLGAKAMIKVDDAVEQELTKQWQATMTQCYALIAQAEETISKERMLPFVTP